MDNIYKILSNTSNKAIYDVMDKEVSNYVKSKKFRNMIFNEFKLHINSLIENELFEELIDKKGWKTIQELIAKIIIDKLIK